MTATETLARKIYAIGWREIAHHTTRRGKPYDSQRPEFRLGWLAIARWVMARERKICRDRKPVTKKP
jgi:hypothetical protein